MIRCLIFDLGNVVVKFSHDAAMTQLADLFAVNPSLIKKILFEDGLHTKFETGLISTANLIVELKAKLEDQGRKNEVKTEDIEFAFNDIFTLTNGIEEVLQSAKTSGLKIVALSNTNPLNISFIEKKWDRIFSKFDEKSYSYRVGSMKPNPKIYEEAIRLSGVQPNECFYTDDIEEYVEAGKKLGLHAAVFTSVENYKNELMKLGVSL